MSSQLVEEIKTELEKVIQFFNQELSKLHTSRANSSLVEGLMVLFAGQEMPLKQLAAISCPGGRQILIQPWGIDYLPAIEQTLRKSSLGLTLSVDKQAVRATIPALSEERRQSVIRSIEEEAEKTRETIRHWRQTSWKKIQDAFQAGEISEDKKFKAKDELQELIDEYNQKVQDIKKKKELEIKEE